MHPSRRSSDSEDNTERHKVSYSVSDPSAVCQKLFQTQWNAVFELFVLLVILLPALQHRWERSSGTNKTQYHAFVVSFLQRTTDTLYTFTRICSIFNPHVRVTRLHGPPRIIFLLSKPFVRSKRRSKEGSQQKAKALIYAHCLLQIVQKFYFCSDV